MKIEKSSKKIIARLEQEGWKLARIRGSHHNFTKEGVAMTITIPHPKREISIGVARDIHKKAGWI